MSKSERFPLVLATIAMPSGGGHTFTNRAVVDYDSAANPVAQRQANDTDNNVSGSSETDAHNMDSTNQRNLILLVGAAAVTAATLGYDVGIMAAAIQPLEVQFAMTGWQTEVAMGSLNFVAAAGAFVGGHAADTYGRKRTVALCCLLFLVGTLVMVVSTTYSVLLVGRIVTGVGVGVAFVTAPCYITEVAPAEQRGQLNTTFDISINGGILVGYVTGFGVQVVSPDNWRLMLGCGMILPALVLCCMSYLPESPRWLMMMHQREDAAGVLRHIGHTSAEVEQILHDMQTEIDRQQRQDNDQSIGASSNKLSWGQRYAIQLGFWQQITGTEAVLYYSADYLQRAGLESPLMRLGGDVFVGICKLVPECIAKNYIDTAGRRPLLLGSAMLLCLSTLGLSLAFWYHASPIITAILLCAVMASFSAGLGPFTFLSASENLSMSERATGLTYASAANRLTSGTVAMTAVTLTDMVGDAGLFAIYAAAGVLSLFFYWNVPETAGVSLEDLAARTSFDADSQVPSPPNLAMQDDEKHEVEIPRSPLAGNVRKGEMA